MEDELIDVVVKEKVRQLLDVRGEDPVDYIIDTISGGEFGTCYGRLFHIGDAHLRRWLPCGMFHVTVERGEEFPEVHDARVTMDDDLDKDDKEGVRRPGATPKMLINHVREEDTNGRRR